jgi:8-amino-7-oxononanoate synthase
MTSIDGNTRRSHLNALITYWRTHAQFKHWQTMPSNTAIQPLTICTNAKVLEVSSYLSSKNIWVPAIRPPTVPLNTSKVTYRLKCITSFCST